MANRSRCCSPPRALPGPAVGDRGDARPLQHLGDGSADREQPGGVLNRLHHGEILEQAPRPHDRGDQAPADRPPRRHGVHLDRTASGRDKPRIMSIVEVSPAPSGPRKAITSPASTASATPRTACTEPNDLRTPASRRQAAARHHPGAPAQHAHHPGLPAPAGPQTWPATLGRHASRAPLPRHHHGAEEPVRFPRHAVFPTARTTTTITTISQIPIPIPPGARNCSQEASGLRGVATRKWSSCPNQAPHGSIC